MIRLVRSFHPHHLIYLSFVRQKNSILFRTSIQTFSKLIEKININIYIKAPKKSNKHAQELQYYLHTLNLIIRKRKFTFNHPIPIDFHWNVHITNLHQINHIINRKPQKLSQKCIQHTQTIPKTSHLPHTYKLAKSPPSRALHFISPSCSTFATHKTTFNSLFSHSSGPQRSLQIPLRCSVVLFFSILSARIIIYRLSRFVLAELVRAWRFWPKEAHDRPGKFVKRPERVWEKVSFLGFMPRRKSVIRMYE